MEERLKEILDGMDIPESRKELTAGNLFWLSRNLVIRNGMHKDFSEANKLIIKLIKGV